MNIVEKKMKIMFNTSRNDSESEDKAKKNKITFNASRKDSNSDNEKE